MNSPFKYFGGKVLLAKELIPLIPAHKSYVEPFGGAAALLFAKHPSKVEVYNDLNSDLANFFRVLRSFEATQVLHENLTYTPYSRAEYKNFLEVFNSLPNTIPPAGDVGRAFLWFYIQITSFSGRFGDSWGFSVAQNQARTFANSIDRLPDLHTRFRHVLVENNSYEEILFRYDTQQTFFYIDPPYVASTRKGGTYKHEMDDSDHENLLEIITCPLLSSKVMLSGYRSPLYDDMLKDWHTIDFERRHCPSIGKTKETGLKGEGITNDTHRRTETIWLNYPPPTPIKQLQLL